ncbi:hypothetical protein STEG23_014456, partial [Scotinomys teguina]
IIMAQVKSPSTVLDRSQKRAIVLLVMELQAAVSRSFQKVTNNKKHFLRLPASKNISQMVLKTETQGINAMYVADALRSTNLLLKESHVKRRVRIISFVQKKNRGIKITGGKTTAFVPSKEPGDEELLNRNKLVQTRSNWNKPVQNRSNRIKPVQSKSDWNQNRMKPE